MKRGFTDRRCPKCSGNIFVDHNSQIATEKGYKGWYEWCLQCGYTSYMESTNISTEELENIPAVKETSSV